MPEPVTAVIAWLAPIASTIIITTLTAAINRRLERERADIERERKERWEWRKGVDAKLDTFNSKLDTLNDATQTNMRTTLIHYCEKYLERGWVTPEERASIWDMHKKYSALNANGFIDSYISRVMELPDREI